MSEHGPPTAMHLREHSSTANCIGFLIVYKLRKTKQGGHLTQKNFLSARISLRFTCFRMSFCTGYTERLSPPFAVCDRHRLKTN